MLCSEKYRTLQKITSNHKLPLLVDHKQTVHRHTSAGNGSDVTATLGTLMLKETRDMRFLALNFVKNGAAYFAGFICRKCVKSTCIKVDSIQISS